MQIVLNELNRSLKNIDDLIDYFDLEAKMYNYRSHQILEECEEVFVDLLNSFNNFYTEKRKFNYNTFIISLYGEFERFIEDIIVAYLEEVLKIIDNYNLLPKKIIDNHFLLSLELLKKVIEPKYGGSETKENALKNLNDCLSASTPFSLNTRAFALHSANFKHTVISEHFSKLEVENINLKIAKDRILKTFVEDYNGLSAGVEVAPDVSFFLLNDLVARRNEVAHGNFSTLLSNSEMKNYVLFFEKYCNSLVKVLNNETLKLICEFKAKLIGPVDKCFDDGKIVCFFSNNVGFKLNDVIIGKNSHEMVQSQIIEIKVDDNNVVEVKDDSNYDVGIKVTIPFKENYELLLSQM
ncbi:hypothetical protein LPB86_15635 [Pedobacter sp. MC2016-14]|uniref:MAE_28990/MAE_18760 family HEPN-like nuclease n=1 Tax=Pedobacter sp. MC2016-14 TaxID=2897327 RepID=UPI001E44CC19|nr:MAE_28990/MAE_18760 family HEPN-like nuclease [Pedobacter sp. MC2016-14]MCD0489673.1 hypothetical protein [Pedobacter sp. MC2016-14]